MPTGSFSFTASVLMSSYLFTEYSSLNSWGKFYQTLSLNVWVNLCAQDLLKNKQTHKPTQKQNALLRCLSWRGGERGAHSRCQGPQGPAWWPILQLTTADLHGVLLCLPHHPWIVTSKFVLNWTLGRFHCSPTESTDSGKNTSSGGVNPTSVETNPADRKDFDHLWELLYELNKQLRRS